MVSLLLLTSCVETAPHTISGHNWLLLLVVASLALWSGCGANNTSQTAPTPTLVSIQVAASSTNLIVGQTEQLKATGKYSDNSTKDLTSSVTWNLSPAGVASVSATGMLAVSSNGTVSVTATFDSVSGSLNFTIAPRLVSISITPGSTTIARATQQQFIANGTYSDGSVQNITATVQWKSSSTAVATISNTAPTRGLAVGVSGPATTTITATSGTISATASLTVSSATATVVTVSPNPAAVALFVSQQFTATATFTDGSTQDITDVATWASSEPLVASVTATGLVAAKQTTTPTSANPIVNISATFESVSGNASLSINSRDLVSISIQPANDSIAQGTKVQFTATGTFSDGSTHNLTAQVTWSSPTDPSGLILQFGSSGSAFGVAPGTITINAVLGSVSGSTTFTVTNAAILSISVTPTGQTVPIGWHQAFTAIGLFSDSSTQDITTSVQWHSSDTTVVSISNTVGSQGIALTAGTGSATATISAVFSSATGSTLLNVGSGTLQSLSLTPASSVLAPGATKQYTATGAWTDGSSEQLNLYVTWSESDTSGTNVAKVGTSGFVTGESAGTALITAQSGGFSASAPVLVEGSTLESVQVIPQNASVPETIRIPFTAIGNFEDGQQLDLTSAVTWTSSMPSVATISNTISDSGSATGVSAGTSIISAVFQNQSATADLTVTNVKLSSISVTPASASISLGSSEQFTAIGTFSDNSQITITREVVWTSSNAGVAVINSIGTANSASAGTATIQAVLNGVSGAATLTVQ